MRILVAHNRYQQSGGEDAVFATEKELLTAAGHQLVVYERDNAEIINYSSWQRLALPLQTIWARDTRQTFRAILQSERPQVAHFHNTFPLISPAVYYSCRDLGIPVVQTLHNYRLLCPNALFFRDGHVCSDCLGKLVPWPGVAHACYRDSRVTSGTVAAMLTAHRLMGTWTELVDVYIALSAFSRQQFIQGGIPAAKIVVKPNFVYHDPGQGSGRGGFALFVGRLSWEKGIDILLAAWEELGGQVPLKIVGDGPLSNQVAEAAKRFPSIEWLGARPKAEVAALMQEARFLVLPSVVYENFPVTIAEAFSTALPVVVSAHGAMQELVEPERTGLHFRPGDARDLAAKVEWMMGHADEVGRMRREARAEFEAKYTAERNYQMLMDAYEIAVANVRKEV